MAATACINEVLTDDELRLVLARLVREEERDTFGLVCRRWLLIQSSERRCLRARAGPAMLRRMADRFTALLELDLSQSASRSFYPGVADSDLVVIARGFRNLRALSLQNCKGISDAGLIALGDELPCLESLDVSCCRKLTDKGLAAIASGCCNLKKLHLDSCKLITDNLLEALSRTCHQLKDLRVSGCVNITDRGLSVLVDGCQQIKSLDVSKCNKIGDIGVSRVAEVCSSSLRILKLLDCCKVGDKSIDSLSKSCQNLDTLVIGGCRDVSDDAIRSLAVSCRQSLRSLRMDWCLKITDMSLSCILSNCRFLEALDVRCCDRVTDSAFQALAMGNFDSVLRFLMVNNCPRITVSGLATLLQFCRSLESLDVRSCPHIRKEICDQAGLQFPECCRVNFSGSLSDMDPLVDVFF